ncbi:hypothetical protein [Actinokineospora bangkokensis]|uniref:Uncharacterized protein n=1 Tax=Actinokineospora bangkokensis TaxID=1193682 RepID=A0A1Q9LK91_9PSEU|nr:hypothetical protein [Actinokineospora bangkokensis]OLR92405.1 hypothetical protein BJP25_20170 [Actinokineospora bangkokensis]
MTTAEREPDELADDELPDELTEVMDQLVAVANECWGTQALFRLLDPTKTEWQGLRAEGEHFVDVDGVLGVLDLNRRAFLPDDLVLLTERLRERLAAALADTPLAVGDRTAVVDWGTVEIVEGQEQPSATIAATATSVPEADEAFYRLTLLTDPEGGVQVTAHERVGGAEEDAADGSAEGSAEGGGVDGDYLNAYYGSDPLPFDGIGLVVDWSTWAPDQVADGGLIGSPVTGRDHEEREYDLYVWFGPETGAQIVSAEPRAAAAGAAEVDPRAYFATEVEPQLRAHCADRGRALEAAGGERFDVSRWIDGDGDYQPEFLDHDGTRFVVSLRATLLGEDEREVRARLSLAALDDVRVEGLDSV